MSGQVHHDKGTLADGLEELVVVNMVLLSRDVGLTAGLESKLGNLSSG